MMLLQNCYHGFSSLLTGETCPLYSAPENGALACNELGLDYVCAVMCKNGFDFVSNPPMVYFCSAAQWQTLISSPPYPYSPQLPWPDCSSKLITERNLFFRSHASGKFHSALLRTLLNPLSRVEKKKSSTKPITCGRVNPDILESVVGVGNLCPVSYRTLNQHDCTTEQSCLHYHTPYGASFEELWVLE